MDLLKIAKKFTAEYDDDDDDDNEDGELFLWYG